MGLLWIPVGLVASCLGVYLIMLLIKGFYRVMTLGKPTVLSTKRWWQV